MLAPASLVLSALLLATVAAIAAASSIQTPHLRRSLTTSSCTYPESELVVKIDPEEDLTDGVDSKLFIGGFLDRTDGVTSVREFMAGNFNGPVEFKMCTDVSKSCFELSLINNNPGNAKGTFTIIINQKEFMSDDITASRVIKFGDTMICPSSTSTGTPATCNSPESELVVKIDPEEDSTDGVDSKLFIGGSLNRKDGVTSASEFKEEDFNGPVEFKTCTDVSKSCFELSLINNNPGNAKGTFTVIINQKEFMSGGIISSRVVNFGDISFCSGSGSISPGVPAPIIFINEFNLRGETGIFAEIAYDSSASFSGYIVEFYDSKGELVQSIPWESGVSSTTAAGLKLFDMTDFTAGYHASPFGVALIDDSNAVLEFLSFSGVTISAIGNGYANGHTSTLVSFVDTRQIIPNDSIQLLGKGCKKDDFAWGRLVRSPNLVNAGQDFTCNTIGATIGAPPPEIANPPGPLVPIPIGTIPVPPVAPSIFINELRLANKDDSFVEIAHDITSDFSGYKVEFYDTNGILVMSLNWSEGLSSNSVPILTIFELKGISENSNVHAPFGVALIDDSGMVLEFLSHGTSTILAQSGLANGQTSTGVSLLSTGLSIQLQGAGCKKDDFVWGLSSETPNLINADQKFTCITFRLESPPGGLPSSVPSNVPSGAPFYTPLPIPDFIVSTPNVFINEMDVSSNESFVEVAHVFDVDVSLYSLALYCGDRQASVVHSWIWDDRTYVPSSGLSFLYFTLFEVPQTVNLTAPCGVALMNEYMSPFQFLSYDGAIKAVDGPAAGLTATDISGTLTNIDTNLQTMNLSMSLTGSGCEYQDFNWSVLTETPGKMNYRQIIECAQTNTSEIINTLPDVRPISEIIFINEMDLSSDDKFVEVAFEFDAVFDAFSLVFYNETTMTESINWTDPLATYALPNQTEFLHLKVFNVSNDAALMAPPYGVAIVDDRDIVVQFLSYEGNITASEGPATGLVSSDVLAVLYGTMVQDASLQLTGSGCEYQDFTWAVASRTVGGINSGQTLLCPSTTPGFTTGTFGTPATPSHASATPSYASATPSYASATSNASSSSIIFINELDLSSSMGFVEVAYQSNVSFSGSMLAFYNSSGVMYLTLDWDTDGLLSPDVVGFLQLNVFILPAQNTTAPYGVALVHANSVVEFLSYGSFSGIQAVDGYAANTESVSIGDLLLVPNTSQTFQLTGSGCDVEDFHWMIETQTQGRMNLDQFFSCQGGNTIGY